jgi:hypothetical protein
MTRAQEVTEFIEGQTRWLPCGVGSDIGSDKRPKDPPTRKVLCCINLLRLP